MSYKPISPLMQRNKKGKHQQVFSEEADEKDMIIAGINFYVRYIGSTIVLGQKSKGCDATEPAVKKVYDDLKRRKSEPRSLKKRIMVVSAENIVISEPSGDSVASFPIGKISFCNVSKRVDKTISFIAKDKPEDSFKAFVFQCESQEKTSQLFQAVSKAFMVHFDRYQAAKLRNPWATVNEEQTAETKQSTQDDIGVRENSAKDDLSTLQPYVPNQPGHVATPLRNPHLMRVRGEQFNGRQRSVTDPPPYHPKLIPPPPTFNTSPLENKTFSSPTLNDDFEQEFTQLAVTRLSRSSSGPVGTDLHDDWTGWTTAQ